MPPAAVDPPPAPPVSRYAVPVVLAVVAVGAGAARAFPGTAFLVAGVLLALAVLLIALGMQPGVPVPASPDANFPDRAGG